MTAFEIVGLGEQAVDYLAAWEHQREVHARVVDGAPDTVLLLEHPPTFTAGKRTDPHERPADPGGAPVIDVDRGGKITFHGPGQVVAYPIVRLPQHVLVVDFVRRMEEAMIATCAAYASPRCPPSSDATCRSPRCSPSCSGSSSGCCGGRTTPPPPTTSPVPSRVAPPPAARASRSSAAREREIVPR